MTFYGPVVPGGAVRPSEVTSCSYSGHNARERRRDSSSLSIDVLNPEEGHFFHIFSMAFQALCIDSHPIRSVLK